MPLVKFLMEKKSLWNGRFIHLFYIKIYSAKRKAISCWLYKNMSFAYECMLKRFRSKGVGYLQLTLKWTEQHYIMQSKHVILSTLVATFSKKKRTGKIHLNNTIIKSRILKNILIIVYNWYWKISFEIFYISFFVLGLWNPMCILYLQHISIRMLSVY